MSVWVTGTPLLSLSKGGSSHVNTVLVSGNLYVGGSELFLGPMTEVLFFSSVWCISFLLICVFVFQNAASSIDPSGAPPQNLMSAMYVEYVSSSVAVLRVNGRSDFTGLFHRLWLCSFLLPTSHCFSHTDTYVQEAFK